MSNRFTPTYDGGYVDSNGNRYSPTYDGGFYKS